MTVEDRLSIKKTWTVERTIVELQPDNILYSLGRSSAHSILSKDQEHWPSETNPAWLLGHWSVRN